MRFLGSLFAALSLMLAAAAALPARAELMRLDTRPGVTLPLAIEAPPGGAVAVALLFAGGPGWIDLSESGAPRQLAGNFLIRSRNHLLARGVAVVMVDAPSDRAGPRGMQLWRLTPDHARDIGQAVRAMRQRFNRPVWVVGTSAGTVSAANAAARLAGAERPDGVVFTSTITRSGQGSRDKIFDVPLGNYTGAAFMAAHADDACQWTPAADVPQIEAALARAAPKASRLFSGGPPPQNPPCEARSAHGFLGIEAQVMGAIAEFMLGARR